LFLGELYRAATLRRVVLVLCGALVALLCNLGRTFFLAAVGAKDGIQAISDWHDPLGLTILAICILSIWGLARVISGPLPKLLASNASRMAPFPSGLASGLGAWVLLTVVGTEVWYRAHETRDSLRWSVAWPGNKKEFSKVTIPRSEADVLACDASGGAAWTDDDGGRWMAFFFKWAEGPARSRILARMHRPENCLPAAGYKLREDRGMINIKAKNLVIPFHALGFEYAGDQVHVFFCLWEDRARQSERPRIRDEWTWLAKLELVVLGERNLGQQVLEVVIFGYDKPEEAEAAFRREVVSMIQTEPGAIQTTEQSPDFSSAPPLLPEAPARQRAGHQTKTSVLLDLSPQKSRESRSHELIAG
jgi:exosortase/archaeosortase family protein